MIQIRIYLLCLLLQALLNTHKIQESIPSYLNSSRIALQWYSVEFFIVLHSKVLDECTNCHECLETIDSHVDLLHTIAWFEENHMNSTYLSWETNELEKYKKLTQSSIGQQKVQNTYSMLTETSKLCLKFAEVAYKRFFAFYRFKQIYSKSAESKNLNMIYTYYQFNMKKNFDNIMYKCSNQTIMSWLLILKKEIMNTESKRRFILDEKVLHFAAHHLIL